MQTERLANKVDNLRISEGINLINFVSDSSVRPKIQSMLTPLSLIHSERVVTCSLQGSWIVR